jgi:MFS family permease
MMETGGSPGTCIIGIRWAFALVSKSYLRSDLSVLLLSVVITRIGFGVIIILFPTYIGRASSIQTSVALALYPIFEAISATPMGRLCDTHGRKTIFMISLASMAILISGIGLTRNIYEISIIHAFMGVSAAGITVASLTMITDLTKVTNRGTGMGSFDFANIGGYAVGLLFAGRLLEIFAPSLGFGFFVTGAIMFVALGGSFVLLKEPHHVKGRGGGIPNPLKGLDSRTRALLPLWVSITTLIGVVFFLPRAFRDVGIGTTTTSYLLFAGVMVLGLGSVGFGRLSDKIGRERVLLIGVVGLSGLLISLGILAQSSSLLTRYWYVVAPFALATAALVPSILATVGDRAKEEFRGAAMGLYSMMLSLGIAVGTLVAGFTHALGGLPSLLTAGAVIFISATIASVLLLRRASRHS